MRKSYVERAGRGRRRLRIPRSCIVAGGYGWETCLRCSLAVRSRTWCVGPADPALVIFAGAWADLFLGVFLADLSSSRSDRTGRNFAGRGVSASGGEFRGPREVLVRADTFVV